MILSGRLRTAALLAAAAAGIIGSFAAYNVYRAVRSVKEHELRLRHLEAEAADREESIRDGLRAAQAALRTQREIADRQDKRLDQLMGGPGNYPPLRGERGVVDPSFPYGDVRRYGIYPDGVTLWEATGHVNTVVLNSSELGLEIFWPAGFYRTSLNIGSSNVSFRFEPGAEFGGVIHVTSERLEIGTPPSRNIRFSGPLVTYDRFGTINVRGLIADDIIMKSDPSKNLSGTRNRGAHIYFGSRDFEIGSITVENAEGADNKSMHASVALDGLGDNPRNIKVGRIWVQDSRVIGVFVTGGGHEFGTIRVDGYCDGPAPRRIQDSDTVSVCNGVWFRRASGIVGAIEVSQPLGSRRDAEYAVVFSGPEIRWAPPWTFPTFSERGVVAESILVRRPPRRAVGVGVYRSPAYARLKRVTVEEGAAGAAAIFSQDGTSILPAPAVEKPGPGAPRR